MAPQRTDAGARLAEIAAQQQQVRDQPHVPGAGVVLREAHAVGDDRGIGLGIGLGHLLQLRPRQAALLLDLRPLRLGQVGRQRLVALGVHGDEIAVQDAAALLIQLQQRLHDALERRRVAARLDLEIGRGDRRGAERRHFQDVLRIGEAFQRALAQRIEDDDRHASARRLVQGAHHARMVGAGVVTHRDDELGPLEIVQRHGALADADGLRQSHAGSFVAHVRTVGKIVGAVLAGVQLKQVGRFVGRAPGRVELRLVRRVQASQHLADARERRFPRHRTKLVAGRVIGHRMRQPAKVLELVVAEFEQLRHRVPLEELGRDPLVGRFPGDGLGAVFTELKGGAMLLVGPGTAWTIEAGGLVGAHQHQRRLQRRHLLADRLGGRLQGAPAAGGSIVPAYARNLSLAHDCLLSTLRAH